MSHTLFMNNDMIINADIDALVTRKVLARPVIQNQITTHVLTVHESYLIPTSNVHCPWMWRERIVAYCVRESSDGSLPQQGPEVLRGIMLAYVVLPAALHLSSILILNRYRLPGSN